MTSLLDPIAFGAIEAPNRIMMAPLTRARATRDHVPTPLMGEYYPNLPSRFAKRVALNAPDPKTFYTSGRVGYTDYPALREE